MVAGTFLQRDSVLYKFYLKNVSYSGLRIIYSLVLGFSVGFKFLVGHHWRDLNFFWGHRARTADLLELLSRDFSL